ncbi:bifunctional alpha/beta hydrolase/OsmC family protein [Algoriphagus sediminis]|uniref:Alpha/beta fold hydrolase n=1 Tax=Algoriphagus sediminis TaxID=3057113 RepID=A0ABT7Y8A3_9BACT|nr:bifunctional alpha/beta hydrolase/OsmC family protein [Algoriphagus sediminis]MDN3202705.1 alpha/beta fold hydrolase [Algoriphagus sediminis]
MNPQKLKFKNSRGFDLAADLYLPLDETPKYFALFAHCFTCSKNFSAVTKISRALSNAGVGVLSFDFTGLGRSEGELVDSSFGSNVTDLLDATEYLTEHYRAPQLLVGHSLGGAAVLYASAKLDNVEAIVTIGAPSYPAHVKNLFKDGLTELEEKGSAEVHIGGRPFRIDKQFVDDLEQKPLSSFLNKLRKSLLIFHSPQDEIVDIENAAEIYQAAFHPKSFISLDGASHMINDDDDSNYIAEVITSWGSRYVKVQEPEGPIHDLKGNQVLIRLSGKGFTTEVKTPYHHLLADEPVDVGGANLGPTPYDLLMSSLGTCTAMTLKMYAERKDWKVSEVKVYLNFENIHKEDALHPNETKSKVGQFTRLIKIEGQLDDKQRARLMEIADRCPVHRTLSEEIEIITKPI